MPAVLLPLLLACGDPPPAAPAPVDPRIALQGPPPPAPPRVTPTDAPLIAVGDPTPESVVLWVNPGTLTRVMIEAWRADDPAQAVQWRAGPLEPAAPPAAPTLQHVLGGLPPATELGWRVRTGDGRTAQGSFRTAPTPDAVAPLTLAVGGDLGGQGWCRPADGRYAILDAIAAQHPDLFVVNGDQVYVDGACPAQAPDGSANLMLPTGHPQNVLDLDWTEPVALREAIDATWAYHRADPAFRALLASTPMVAQWDDHEVVNDFGAGWERWATGDAERPGYRVLVDQARGAFLAWNPMRLPEATRIHRSLRWGAQAELFIVDARSHRSHNAQPDGPDKTLLGTQQLQWLRDGLTRSQARWKIVSVDVPMSIPTGSAAWRSGRDGWASGTGDPSTPAGEADLSAATGFEHELGLLLRDLRDAGVQGVVFVTTDVHHSRILRYDLGGGVTVHEIVSGPLRAWSGPPTPLDPSFAPQELYAEGEVSTYALLQLGADGALTITIRGEDGAVRPGATLTLPAPG